MDYDKKDCNNKKNIRLVISLDGGGTRGFHTVHLIEILSQLAECDLLEYADLFGGTSTGGIISLAKGMGNIDNEKLLKVYDSNDTKEIFSNPKVLYRIVKDGCAYSPKKLKKLVLTTLGENVEPKTHHKNSFVVSLAKEIGYKPQDGAEINSEFKPVIISNYKKGNFNKDEFEDHLHFGIGNQPDQFNVPTAIQCTAGIPAAFNLIEKHGYTFYDGGFDYNNPVSLVYKEASKLYPNEQIVILSFGTGSFNEPGKNKDKEDKTIKKILEINNESNKRLMKYINFKDEEKGIFTFARNTKEIIRLVKNCADLPSPNRLFKNCYKNNIKDENVYFFRFDNQLDRAIKFQDTGKDSFDHLKQKAVDLFSKNPEFQSIAQTLKKVLEFNGITNSTYNTNITYE